MFVSRESAGERSYNKQIIRIWWFYSGSQQQSETDLHHLGQNLNYLPNTEANHFLLMVIWYNKLLQLKLNIREFKGFWKYDLKVWNWKKQSYKIKLFTPDWWGYVRKVINSTGWLVMFVKSIEVRKKYVSTFELII